MCLDRVEQDQTRKASERFWGNCFRMSLLINQPNCQDQINSSTAHGSP